MNDVIEVKNVSKGFMLHHEKTETIFEFLSNIIHKKSKSEFLQVLDDVSFSVKKGETLGIIGKNGSGKSTLLKLISNIYKPDNGTIIKNGSIIPLLQLGIGFHPELTPINNIMTYGAILGYTKNQIKSLIPKILKYAELEKFSNVKIKNFSTGMYARLAFSTAIFAEPDILIIDEVFAVGDSFFQNKCISSIKEIIMKNHTVILVSHDSNILSELCDRIMILNNGKIESIGDPKIQISRYLKNNFDEKLVQTPDNMSSNQINNSIVNVESIKSNCGYDLPIGSNHYRAYVGPPDKYDSIASSTFSLLTLMGLRENNSLLDIGCGSLRNGRLFIPYLLPGKYCGIEPNSWLVEEGIKNNIGNDIITLKKPMFSNDDTFNFSFFNQKFDYLFAQSIFSHATQNQIRKCLSEAKNVMHDNSVFVATFFNGKKNSTNEEWAYPDSVTYTYDFMKSMIEDVGLYCNPLKWIHPSGQNWISITKLNKVYSSKFEF